MRQGKLSQHLQSYCDKAIMFCMPAHNGTLEISASLDVTELSFSDNLMDANGIIAQCEQDLACAYGVDHAMMFTAGATSAIATALALCKTIGDTVIIDSRAHKSVYSYAQLLGITLINIDNIQEISHMILGGILMTTPDYFGNTYDIRHARELANQHKIPLIIDQSHGGHFVFSTLLPNGNENIGDIVINSLHKTLPVLTGGAVVCVNARYYADMLIHRAELHSSSPSYLTMVSIDNAVADFMENGERYYRDIHDKIATFKATLDDKFRVYDNDDYSRLVIISTEYRGIAVQQLLQQHHIYIEMTYQNKLVLIVTPFNYEHLDTLATVLNSITWQDIEQYSMAIACRTNRDCANSDSRQPLNITNVHSITDNHYKISSNDRASQHSGAVSYAPMIDGAQHSTSGTQESTADVAHIQPTLSGIVLVSPHLAIGQVAATNIGIYPPGIPVIIAGQAITLQNIHTILDSEGELFGMVADKIPCLRSK